MIGQPISHYRILEKIGEGGMGVLYLAVDSRLGREVAVKLLRPEAVSSVERRERFVREAKAASALNHPHIITIHDIGRESIDGVERDFIVMEYVKGRSLEEIVSGGPLPQGEALRIAAETADALSAAHESGIVHRDIKPANLMVTEKGHVKVLDFGLAKLVERSESGESSPTRTAGAETEEGVVLGTAAYMSPEQAEGKPVDCRSDAFSLGVVLYQMLTGRRPFQGDSHVSTRLAILHDTPPSPREIRKDVPAELERVVLKCLEKSKEKRYASAAELFSDLERLRTQPAGSRRRLFVPAAVVFLALAAAGTWWWVRSSRVRWARESVSEITRLVDSGKPLEAFRLAREAMGILPEDAELQRLWKQWTFRRPIETEPPGAFAYWRDYADADGEWELSGTTPIQNVDLPYQVYLRWRFTKEGFGEAEAAAYPRYGQTTVLRPSGEAPAGMVYVPGGSAEVGDVSVEFKEYWVDRYEITNREYKSFVDAGGYENREYWKHPFVENGRELSWEDALARFVDTMGRPGPSTWELGSYPDGEEDFPVRGVSWYEAAAYAEFAGKSLPSVHHWLNATDEFGPPSVLELSNFDGKGPARVGTHQGLGPYGTYDMAGNVKEWTFNPSGERRFVVGGSWDEPVYMYRFPNAQSPFDRPEGFGFRCARYPESPPEAVTGPIDPFWGDYSKKEPVSDEVFEVYRSIYSYDRAELNSKAEPVESSSIQWTKERIEFDAAYGGERMIAYLFLPANAAPPYQTVIYFPGAGAYMIESHESGMWYVDFIVRSGRALLYPIYKGTFERRSEDEGEGPNAYRDHVIQLYKDLARSVDYLLETREDIDRDRIAFYGFSIGANYGPIFTALDKRFRASILLAGGFDPWDVPAEVDPLHFAPRATTPVLMINGRDDFRSPLDASQKPMFQLLGAPEKDKRHALIEGGHIPLQAHVMKETLDWLDRYLGRVTIKRP